MGGIAAALRLRARGAEVTVLESCPDAGGRARAFTFDGHRFDAGPTVITAPYLFSELFTLFGKRLADYVELRALDPVWYRYQFDDGMTCDYGPRAFFLEQLATHFPEEVDGYRTLYDKAEELFALGYEQLADQPFDRLSTMLAYLPQMIRHQGYRSVYALISRHIRNPRLRRMLATPPLLLGGNPKQASAIYFLIHILEQRYGVHYAIGGTAALLEALLRLAEEEGVTIRYDTQVIGFDWQDHTLQGVRCADGMQYACDRVVYNGDPVTLYQELLPASAQSLFTRLRTRFHSLSMGLLVIYFATDRRYDTIAHHTIGLSDDYDAVLADLFRHRQNPQGICYYLHRPAATDPQAAPADMDLFYVLAPLPPMPAKNTPAADYDGEARRVMAHLDATVLPGLQQACNLQRHISPPYFANTLHSTRGAGFSLQPTLTQSAWARYHNQDGYFHNLHLVGAGVHPGAGLPGTLNSAKVLDRLLA